MVEKITSIKVERCVEHGKETSLVVFLNGHTFTLTDYDKESIKVNGKHLSVRKFFEHLQRRYDNLHNLCRYHDSITGMIRQVYQLYVPTKLDIEFRKCFSIQEITMSHVYLSVEDMCDVFVLLSGTWHTWIDFFSVYVLNAKVIYIKVIGWDVTKFYRISVTDEVKFETVMAKSKFIK